ncbi:MAG TPA: phosphoglycerol geranylgeranyltransferase [Candidatus Syntrophoarchaeum butanivorans]|uniref:Geranylgeranylglyceryl phosphate synthase n=1 Tax=Candidatus Syntropharchaeum butanivorans TaxID=1839936 RepID=A0A1F2P571_9EURY|nr:MAG: geranylgeranylglyceryl phosphate synthase family protein [Candidatus Syntrophoarchaeum butanivorans]RJS70705.1 MAG: phosphoglycerol geranylgeranyltransferase [Candidatus Syntrophoarchaeum sp. WYZ-LMO15]HDM36953.1 phosphoglycerol geranylgeranyltransferase [Candidatus Syntrophoarchaeum butanivorans]HEC57547.1 phosphoglycerol geranylgeranyltransferase [Candidatus Syntrophoarchaeum butanivorans]
MWKEWKHVTKLDPDRGISDAEIRAVVDSGTDAVMISGTQNITGENVRNLLQRLEGYSIPKILEPSAPEVVTFEGFDYIFVPSVINSSSPGWIIGKHIEWVKMGRIEWDLVVPEAYIVLNPDSAVAKVTGAKTDLSKRDVAASSLCAERYFHFPIIYIEYSGRYGDPEIVRAAKDVLSDASLFYGGGITAREQALEMSEIADVIVVGNVLYELGVDAFLETIP